MKTTMKLLVIALLALPQTMHAQMDDSAIAEVFHQIVNSKDFKHSTVSDVHRDNGNEVDERTTIYNLSAEKPNAKLLDELKEAFSSTGDATVLYTCFDPQPGSPRRPLAIRRKNGGAYKVGEMNGSSYALATFNDPQREGYRTVYAAEWGADDKGKWVGVLIVSYGEKPETFGNAVTPGQKIVDALGLADMIRNGEYQSMLDSIMTEHFPNGLPATSLQLPATVSPRADYYTNPEGWRQQAMRNLANLDGSDWLRLFGMLTQNMIDNSEQKGGSDENMIAIAGILLDMSKEAPDLDKDEKAVCAARLQDVAQRVSDRNEYVFALLSLAAKRLQQ